MQPFNEYSLKEICLFIVDCPHSTPKWLDQGVFVIRSFNIKNGRLNTSRQSYISEAEYKERTKRARPSEGDLIITREAPMGEVCLIPKNLKCCLGQRVVLLRPNQEKVYPQFLLYTLQSPYLQHQIHWSEGTGTTVSNLRIPFIEMLKIPLPPLETQKKIAAVLSSLDDKIELNTRMNKVLEEIALVIFKRWFVEFEFPNEKGEPYRSSGGKMKESELGLIPEGWGVKKFEEILTPRKEKSNSPDIPEYSVTNTGIHPRNLTFKKKLSMKGGTNKIIYENDLVFGMSREILNWGVMMDKIGGVSAAYHVFIVRDEIPPVYLESYMKHHISYFDDLIRLSTREGQGIDKVALMRKMIFLPPADLLYKFNEINDSIQRMRKNCSAETEKLVEIRDTLLPKLMSENYSQPLL